MKKKSRISNSIRNSLIALGGQLTIMISQFVIQTVFVKTLGANYIGANGLFSNLLSFLSFADLGVGTAITYSLYKPLAQKNEEEISAVMNLFRRLYTIIGLIILTAGLILAVFIPNLINKNSTIPNVQGMFILYLLNSVISYFFTYKRTLLIADQQSYVDSVNRMVFTFIQTVVQIVFLITTQEYITYLIIQITFTFLSNLSISMQADKRYTFLSRYRTVKTGPTVIRKLKKNAAGAVFSNIGSIAAYGTDNILVSKFLGLHAVGIYSSYMLVFNAVQNIVNQVSYAIVASIADLANSSSQGREEKVFYEYMYLISFVAFSLSTSIYMVIQGFVTIWLGSEYHLAQTTVFLIVLNWNINLLRRTLIGFMQVHGLYWETRWKSILESTVNLFVGLFLLNYFHLGISSVVIGTLSANIFINMWWEPLITLKNGVKTQYLKYYVKYFKYLAFCFVSLTVVYQFHHIGLFQFHSILGFLIVGVISFICSSVSFVILTFRTDEFKYYLQIVRKRILN